MMTLTGSLILLLSKNLMMMTSAWPSSNLYSTCVPAHAFKVCQPPRLASRGEQLIRVRGHVCLDLQ